MDILKPVSYILEHCGIYFAIFLFLKVNIDVAVMVICHLELTKLTGASLGFGKTLLGASFKIFSTSVFARMYDPHAPTLVGDEGERKVLRNRVKLYEIQEHIWKKEEHLYSVMSPA